MAVYIDDMYKYELICRFRRMKMSHMVADTKEELLKMADTIGVHRKWVQKENTPSEHFDICVSKRAKAIKAGAVEISYRDLGEAVYYSR